MHRALDVLGAVLMIHIINFFNFSDTRGDGCYYLRFTHAVQKS